MSNEIKRPQQDDSRPMGQPKPDSDRDRSSRQGNPDFERQRSGKPGSPDSDSDRLDQNQGQGGTRRPGGTDTDQNDTDNE